MSSRDETTAARLGAWSDLSLAMGAAVSASEALREAEALGGGDPLSPEASSALSEALAHLAHFGAQLDRIRDCTGPAEYLLNAQLKARANGKKAR